MDLYLKQKVFSLRTRFDVYDATEAVVFQVVGEFALGARLHVLNSQGQEVAFIRQRLFSFLPCYEIELPGWPPATLFKRWTIFRQSFDIDDWGWQAEGDFLAHEYSLLNESQTLMTVSKAWLTWGDSYHLNIAANADPLACVCCLLAMDMAMAQSDNN